GALEFNVIRSGRPKFRKDADVNRSRQRAPQSGDEVHMIAEYFFRNRRSEVLAWQMFFAFMTGCRTSELLRLRLDSRSPDEPGYIAGNYRLLGRRSKGGVHPYAYIWPVMREMMDAFFAWPKKRYSISPWFLPGRTILSKNQVDEARKMIEEGMS